MENKISVIVTVFFIFAGISILTSLWLGYVWRNSYFISLLSSILTYRLYKRWRYSFHVPKRVLVLSFIMLVLVSYPLLLIHPFVPASADTFPTTIVRVIGETIPETFAPYSNMKLTYQLGFFLFAKIFTDIFSFIPDYLVLWGLGMVFSALQVILVYNFAKTIFGKKEHGEWAALLLIGTKIIFQNSYWGGYHVLMAIDLFLLYFPLFIEKNKLCYLLFPAILATHPSMALMAVLFTGIFLLFYGGYLRESFLLISSAMLALPSMLTTYATVLMNMFSPSSYPYPIEKSVAKLAVLIVAWFGVIPSFFALLSLGYALKRRDRQANYVLAVFFISLLSYLFLYASGYFHADKIFIFVTYSGLLISSIAVGEYRGVFKNLAMVVALALCALTFFASHELAHLRGGSKVSMEEVEFALKFKEYDPRLVETLFLSPGKAWMAHLSNKIPYDAKNGWFLPYADSTVVKDEGWTELNDRRRHWEEIYYNKCMECIYKLNVTYVVVNKNYFNVTLKEKPVLQYKYFDVYKLKLIKE